ncbi:MAG: methyltransferase [Candidatus Adlerbacteria bacterium]|nr:methyltransferase [Candidatus Adlerbacteria bacterium]
MASEERFGYEWNKYAAISPLYEGQFRNWTGMGPEDFAGKDILDAGCGMGRNSYWPLAWGAKSVTAFDNDEHSLAAARKTLESFPNATVVRHDISKMPWDSAFDTVMCIGVLHHVRQPRLALENFTRALRPGGQLVVWVYSYEGNEWIVSFVDPVRKLITSRLPLPLIHALSYLCSAPLYYLAIPLLRRRIAYLQQLSTFPFWHVHSIVFDQLIPAVANYWTREEVLGLTHGLALSNIEVVSPANHMGWTLTAVKI